MFCPVRQMVAPGRSSCIRLQALF